MTATERMYKCLSDQNKRPVDLCRFLDISSSVLAGWKVSAEIPPSKYLVRISEFLGITVDYLLTGQEDNSASSEEIVTEPRPKTLRDDELDLLAMYGFLSPEGKRWVKYLIKGYLEDSSNLSSSRHLGMRHKQEKQGETA